jgi:hypothetical protein
MSSPNNPAFEHALKCIPALVQAFKQDDVSPERAANVVLDKQLEHATSSAEAYMYSLLKAYIHVMVVEKAIPRDIAQDLRTFILGDYNVCGALLENGRFHSRTEMEEIQEAQRKSYTHFIAMGEDALQRCDPTLHKELYDPPVATIAIPVGNHLAVWKICEKELTKAFGDKDVGKRLAASTARLFVNRTSMKENGNVLAPALIQAQKIFVKNVTEQECNPFRKARVMEFAGNQRAFTPSNFPVIALFQHYQDYTPELEYCISPEAGSYAKLANPGALFTKTHHWDEKQKYDYLIASNVFCKGAVEQDYQKLVPDLLPLLANCLRDNGKLIISNTAPDGIGVIPPPPTRRKRKRPEPVYSYKEYGLATDETRVGLFTAIMDAGQGYKSLPTSDSGISVLRRDYKLRPPIPYTHEERQHDATLPPDNPLTYVEKVKVRKDIEDRHRAAINRDESAGWDIDL